MTTPFEKDLRRLLDDLCVQLGFCLPPDDNDRLISAPPADPKSFTAEVFFAEGFELGSAPLDLYRQVLELVTATYDQAAAPRPSTMKEVQEGWHRTRTHLDRARAALGDQGPQLERFQEYLDHNELELALEELEHLGEGTPAPVQFWAELRSAAEEMRLTEQHERLHRRMRETEA